MYKKFDNYLSAAKWLRVHPIQSRRNLGLTTLHSTAARSRWVGLIVMKRSRTAAVQCSGPFRQKLWTKGAKWREYPIPSSLWQELSWAIWMDYRGDKGAFEHICVEGARAGILKERQLWNFLQNFLSTHIPSEKFFRQFLACLVSRIIAFKFCPRVSERGW